VVGYLGLIRDYKERACIDNHLSGIELYDSGDFKYVDRKASLALLEDFKVEVKRFRAKRKILKSNIHQLQLKEDALEVEVEKYKEMHTFECKRANKWEKVASALAVISMLLLVGLLL